MAKKRMLGQVDLLGLNEFGQNPGLNPIFGVLIGGGVSGTTALALRHATTGTPQKYADAIGFGTGVLTSIALLFMPATRHSGWASLAGAFLATGLRAIESAFSSSGSVGIPMIEHLGLPQIQALNGFGMHQIGPIPQSYGTIPGVAGTQLGGNGGPPVDLMGGQSTVQQQATLLGAPHTSPMANAYGANLFGGRT